MTTIAALHRRVQLTGRTSAVLFTSSQIAQALRLPTPGAWRVLYALFVAAHALHFGFVAWFAHRTQGRSLFPGGRDMADVGGWPTMFSIFGAFMILAVLGWADGEPPKRSAGSRRAGKAAKLAMGAMFASFYIGQVQRAHPGAGAAAVITAAVALNTVIHPVPSRTG